MREAARLGKRVLLVEQNDFASGTSSRSTKLVHEAVRERERLVRDGVGLVERQEFLLPITENDRLRNWLTLAGLGIYDLFAGKVPGPRHLHAAIEQYAPGLTRRYTGAFAYGEAKTDDAGLVLCVLHQGCRLGGRALNYVAATEVLRDTSGRVSGARLCDREAGFSADVHAHIVVNATGPWADRLRGQLGVPPAFV